MKIRLKFHFITLITFVLLLDFVQEVGSKGGRAGGKTGDRSYSGRSGSRSYRDVNPRDHKTEAKTKKSGTGLSAWAIVGIILAIIFVGVGIYYGLWLYCDVCRENEYSSDERREAGNFVDWGKFNETEKLTTGEDTKEQNKTQLVPASKSYMDRADLILKVPSEND